VFTRELPIEPEVDEPPKELVVVYVLTRCPSHVPVVDEPPKEFVVV
jgi:hypothetical protein